MATTTKLSIPGEASAAENRWPTYWYMPLSSFSDGAAATKVTSVGTNPGQWTGTVHQGATLGPGSEWQASVDSRALEFNGVGLNPADGHHVSIDGGVTVGGGALSVCVRAKWTSFNLNSMLIDIGNGQRIDNVILFNDMDTNTLVFAIYRGAPSSEFEYGTTKTVNIENILQLNTWTHICATVSASGYMAVLVNSVEQNCKYIGEARGGDFDYEACDPTTKKGSNGWTPNRLLRSKANIGKSNWNKYTYFAGSVSDLTIIDGHAVTEEEAAEIMNYKPITTTTLPPATPGDVCATSRDCTDTQCKNKRCCKADIDRACTSCDDAGFCVSFDKDLLSNSDNNPDSDADADGSTSGGGLDTGTIIGIVVSVVIAAIGGVVMLLKSRKDAENMDMIRNEIRHANRV